MANTSYNWIGRKRLPRLEYGHALDCDPVSPQPLSDTTADDTIDVRRHLYGDDRTGRVRDRQLADHECEQRNASALEVDGTLTFNQHVHV